MDWPHLAASATAFLADWRHLTAVASLLALGAWRYVRRGARAGSGSGTPDSRSLRSAWDLKLVRLVGALTKDEQRSRQCLETQRLARDDAKEIEGYLPSPLHCEAPAAVKTSSPSHRPTRRGIPSGASHRVTPNTPQKRDQSPRSPAKPG